MTDTANVKIACADGDRARAQEILGAWEAPLPKFFAVEEWENIGRSEPWVRVTVANATHSAYLVITRPAWESVQPAALADHLARLLERITRQIPREPPA